MFERYTYDARKVIFFARFEASQLGSGSINPEHLLLGIVHEKDCWANAQTKLAEHGELIRSRFSSLPRLPISIPTSVDMPLDNTCRRVLAYAAEIATELHDPAIRPEHLLLGILREPSTFAARVLNEIGVSEDGLRQKIGERPRDVFLPEQGSSLGILQTSPEVGSNFFVREPDTAVQKKAMYWPGIAVGLLGGSLVTLILMKSC